MEHDDLCLVNHALTDSIYIRPLSLSLSLSVVKNAVMSIQFDVTDSLCVSLNYSFNQYICFQH